MQVIINSGKDVRSHGLKQWMTGCDPFQCWLITQALLVEDDLGVLTTETSVAILLLVSYWNQVSRHLADAIAMAALGGLFWAESTFRAGVNKELFDDLWHQAAFLGLGTFTDDRR